MNHLEDISLWSSIMRYLKCTYLGEWVILRQDYKIKGPPFVLQRCYCQVIQNDYYATEKLQYWIKLVGSETRSSFRCDVNVQRRKSYTNRFKENGMTNNSNFLNSYFNIIGDLSNFAQQNCFFNENSNVFDDY